MIVPFLDLEPAYRELEVALQRTMTHIASGGQYLLGPQTTAFEEEFREFVGTRFCVTVGSGLDALTIALKAQNIGAGDEVIVPNNTFIATWLAVTRLGARVVPVDPNPSTYNLDDSKLNSALTPRSRAIIAVHLYGSPCNISRLTHFAQQQGLPVVEDAAQAHGASFDGHPVGSLGDVGCWSFYPSKNLGAFGDAGAITTNNPEIAEFARVCRNYGAREKHRHDLQGFNSRISELDAGVLRIKLRVLTEWNRRRADAAQRYAELLRDLPMTLPSNPPKGQPSWHLYVVRTDARDAARRYLAEHGVQTHIHYPVPPYRQPAYSADYASYASALTDQLSERILSLPIGPHVTDGQITYVSEVLHRFFDEKGDHERLSIPS